ncbi:MAG: hypothetical protein KJ737_07455 [Proteobacteria bacterium]|nr:hypothetical protein [Pseudomonadota bacterium]
MIKKIYCLAIAFLIPISFVSLTGCDLGNTNSGPSEPATIEFISPANGMVFPFGTNAVTISGKIIPGTDPVKSLKVIKGTSTQTLAFSADTYEFNYNFALDPSKTVSICTVEVCDTKNITNQERICFYVGDSAVTGDPSGGDNALGISITEDLINSLVEIVEDKINEVMPDIIESLLPIHRDVLENSNLLGEIVIDPDYVPGRREDDSYIGRLEIGNIDIDKVDCLEGDGIMVGLSISSLYVQGYQTHVIDLLGNTNFSVSTNEASVGGLILSLGLNNDDKITASIDMSNISLSIKNPEITYGRITIPDGLLTSVIEAVESVLRRIEFEINDYPIMDANALTLEIANVNIGLWTMSSDSFFTTDENSLSMELGIGMTIDDFYHSALYPDSDRFIVTEGDMPEIHAAPGENDLVIAVSDDLINQSAFTLVQAGLLTDINLTAIRDARRDNPLDKEVILEIGPIRINLTEIAERINLDELGLDQLDLKVMASVTTPPVCDFSGEGLVHSGTEPLGTFIIPNLVIEISNINVASDPDPLTIRFSIDITAAIGIDIDGTLIKGNALPDLSELDVNVLYFSKPGIASLLNPLIDLGLNIAERIANDMISATVEVKVPENKGFTIPDIELTGNAFENDFLIMGVNVDF